MIGRLVLLSILVGVILAAIGLDPWNIVESVRRLVEHVWNMGFDAVRWLWQYFLLGAVIVVPIWLLVRLAKAPRGQRLERRDADQRHQLVGSKSAPACARDSSIPSARRLLGAP